MGHTGRTGARRARWPVAILLLLVTVASACAEGDDDGEVGVPASFDEETTATPGSTTVPPCSESRHAVVFEFLGTLTLERDFGAVVAEQLQVLPRPGAAEVAAAYHERGYELVYVSTAPTNMPVGDASFVDALNLWLTQNGFPVDDRTRVWTWDATGDAVIALLEELLRMEQAGVSLDGGYTDDADKANAMASGGVPPEGLWTLGPAAGTASSTALAGDDFLAHLDTVERLGMVCQLG
ncbi:MAG TPA: hypothetical protein VIL48_16815 [Acidimicrobiales bacterium]